MRHDYLQAAGKPGVQISNKIREQFRAGLVLLDAASANIVEAGMIFNEIDQETWDALIEDAPPPMRKTLSSVRAVGAGSMIPQLATASGYAAERLKTLPITEQLRLWTSPVEMFAPGRTGRYAKYLRFATDMDSEELKRAFVKEGSAWRIRTYEEQKSYEVEKAAYKEPEKPSGVDRAGRWAIRNGKVYLAKAKVESGLSKRDVETILKDLEDES